MNKGARRAGKAVGSFLIDYLQRHRHPVNAALHIVGVPAVFYGLFCAASGRSQKERSVGVGLIVFGYILQYLGHRKQGNEVGEVSLIKFLIAKIRDAGRESLRNIQWASSSENDSRTGTGATSSGGNGNGNGNGNGHHGKGGNGHNSADGRYILWWKTSH